MNGDARAIEIDGISKRYGQTVAVEDLTFGAHAGEVFGFVGRNGAGKTTTMRVVLGVLAPDAGAVRWMGEPLTFDARRRIGYMPEERGLYPRMPVADQLAYLGELHGMAGGQADLLWFLLGFLFYATAYAAVASLVSRQEEIQGAIAPIAVFQIVGYLLMYASLPNPNGPLATVGSLLPPFAPILMAVRMADTDVPAWQVGLAIALIVASIGFLTWLAGRIYTNAALRVGTRVRFMDAFRG